MSGHRHASLRRASLARNRSRNYARRVFGAVLLIAIAGEFWPVLSAAQPVPVPAQEREALTQLVNEAAAKGLPSSPLANKVQEGLAKGIDPKRIEAVVRQMATNLEAADRLVHEIEPAAAGAGRDGAVTLLAESLGGGVSPDEVRELRRVAESASGEGQTAMSAEAVASAAKGLAFIKDAGLPMPEGTAVIAEAVKQRFRASEMLDLGREVKRREGDYRAGRATLRSLREAIARGERPPQLLRDGRAVPADRPAAARPQTPADRPVGRPDVPQRAQPPVRPEPVRPERPGR